MKKLLLSLSFLGLLWASPALAVTSCELMGDADFTVSTTDTCIILTTPFTTVRHLNIPKAGATAIGQGGAAIGYADSLLVMDIGGAINGANTLQIVPASQGTINGSASPMTITTAAAFLELYPLSGSDWWLTQHGTSQPGPGGTTGQIQFNAGNTVFGGFTASGDLTINTGTGVATLATVNANVGSFGSATTCTAFTTNAKGLITAASAVTCTPAIASITGLGTGVATALGTAVGTAGSFIVNGGALGTPSSGTLTNATGLVASSGIAATGTPSATTCLRGDNTWSTCGTVTSVATGGGLLGGPVTTTGTLTLRQATIQKFTAAAGPLTYTSNAASKFAIVRFCGAGGGGSGSGTGTSGGSGTAGTSTIFNGITCPGGGAATASTGGSGGTACTGGTPDISWIGENGGGVITGVTGNFFNGGPGGSTILFGGGHNGIAVAGTGAGGRGGAFNGAGNTGGGGGSGSCAIQIVPGGGATYSYTVGTGGPGGAAGTSGNVGSAGSDGIIMAVEY